MEGRSLPVAAGRKSRAPGGRKDRPLGGGRLYRFSAYLRKHWFLYLLMLPGFCFMAVFNYGPMSASCSPSRIIRLAWACSPRPGRGLNILSGCLPIRPSSARSRNTIIINIYNLVFGFTFAIFLALMINEIKLRKVKSVVQTCVYLPYFLSWVIFAGLVQVFLEYPSNADIGGAINQIIQSFGGEPIDFLKRPGPVPQHPRDLEHHQDLRLLHHRLSGGAGGREPTLYGARPSTARTAGRCSRTSRCRASCPASSSC